MRSKFLRIALGIGAAGALFVSRAQNQKSAPASAEHAPIGYTDTPVIPGQKWRVHDIDRPRPRRVTPGAQYGQPPSDANVLFDGKDISKWVEAGTRENAGKTVPVSWMVTTGYLGCVP